MAVAGALGLAGIIVCVFFFLGFHKVSFPGIGCCLHLRESGSERIDRSLWVDWGISERNISKPLP